MVIRGNIRGNGEQLANYLLSGEANENVQILEVDGRLNATDQYLYQTMHGMSLMAELTKSQKGLYHAQINPAYTEDQKMTRQDWLMAADILGHELGLGEQRRVVVLHTKKDRTHAHVVFERYDHQTGKVVENKFSRLAQDRARKEMERVFEHQPTPHRNKHRPELKETLTDLWHQTDTGKDFVRAVHDSGYLLAEGVPRHPFMVVDENGRSFDLVRQIQGVRIKEVRQRMRNETLIPEKEAIELMRQKQEGSSESSSLGQQIDSDREKALRTASLFWDNKHETTLENPETEKQKRLKSLADSFAKNSQDMTEEAKQDDSFEKKKTLAKAYSLNADELTAQAKVTDENTVPIVNDHAKAKEDITIEPQNDESQQKVAEEVAADREEILPPSEDDQHRKTLADFMREEEGMFAKTDPTLDESKQRQQLTAREFLDNEEITTPELTEEKALQKLILEQREIREHYQQRKKKRLR